MKTRQTDRETQYRPQAGKTLREALRNFIRREFPRLGGPWVIEMFVDKLLQVVDRYHLERDQLQPGQTLWPAVALDEAPGYRKPIYATRQVPVVLTLVNQEDIAAMRQGSPWTEILQGELVRAMKEAQMSGDQARIQTLQNEQMKMVSEQGKMMQMQFKPMLYIGIVSIPLFMWSYLYIGEHHLVMTFPFWGEQVITGTVIGPVIYWFYWYFICSIPVSQIIRKALNVGSLS